MREYRVELIRTVTETCVVFVESEDLWNDPDQDQKVNDAASEGDWEYHSNDNGHRIVNYEDKGKI